MSADEVWFEGKAFEGYQENVYEFRGAEAEGQARQWFSQATAGPFDSAYVYRIEGERRTLLLAHAADTYPWDGTDEDDDDKWWDDVTHDADDDADLDWAAGECSMMADGQCGQAGSEHCDFECPFRDGEIVEVESDETKGQ